jgi:hypothetical protein
MFLLKSSFFFLFVSSFGSRFESFLEGFFYEVGIEFGLFHGVTGDSPTGELFGLFG